MFLAQPAEERGKGAKAMLDDGLFTRVATPDIRFAAHVGNGPAGEAVVKHGVATSNSDSLAGTFHGRGAHGAMPSASIDPIVIGAHCVSDVQTVISRQTHPNAFGVVTAAAMAIAPAPEAK